MYIDKNKNREIYEERINKEFKRRTKSMETVGEQSLMSVVTFVAFRLEMGWRVHAVDSKSLEHMPGGINNTIEKTVETMGLLN